MREAKDARTTISWAFRRTAIRQIRWRGCIFLKRDAAVKKYVLPVHGIIRMTKNATRISISKSRCGKYDKNRRDRAVRTPDILLPKQARYRLRYIPKAKRV